jgi:hypothetical protein
MKIGMPRPVIVVTSADIGRLANAGINIFFNSFFTVLSYFILS